MKKKEILALLLAVSSAGAVLGGCAGGKTNSVSGELEKVTTPDTYPLDTDVTLRYWMPLNGNVSANFTSFNDTQLKADLEEATGVKLKFEHPSIGQETEAFNIMQSSDDLPDIIEWDWSAYPGGPQKAIDDEFIISLDSYIDKVSPNLKKLIEEHPEWKTLMTTDEGTYFQYPFIRGDDVLSTYMTYIIRKDLLDEAGLDVPETLGDWETVLYKFKEMGVKAPLSLRFTTYHFNVFSPLTGVFGFASGFYHDADGKVKYGPYEDKFRDYITLLNKWYNDGILDREFADADGKRRAAMVTNGENGIADAAIGGEFGNYLSAILPESGIEYVAIKPPVKEKGDSVFWTQKDWPVVARAAISATSQNAEIAARFLDYGYSEEGHMLYNFGKEGVSYELKDGERGKNIPTYTDIITDPDKNGGLPVAQAMAGYVRASYNGPFVQDAEYIYQYYGNKAQKDALSIMESDTFDYKLPPLYYKDDEQKRYTDIMTTVETYQNETMIKLISGKLDLSYLDTYYSELKKLGIEEAISIVQAAYERAQNR